MSDADELLRSAFIDHDRAVTCGFTIDELDLLGAATLVHQARVDLGQMRTFVMHGRPGERVGASELVPLPFDLDLARAEDLDEAREHWRVQRGRAAGAITVGARHLAVWGAALLESGWSASRSLLHIRQAKLPLPLSPLLPLLSWSADVNLQMAACVRATSLLDDKATPLIACAQGDFTKVYEGASDPGASLADFFDAAAEHARADVALLERRERSVARFLDIAHNGEM